MLHKNKIMLSALYVAEYLKYTRQHKRVSQQIKYILR
jgi:hypothetical protein